MRSREMKHVPGNRANQEGGPMSKKLHKALEAVVPHVREGSQIFVLDSQESG